MFHNTYTGGGGGIRPTLIGWECVAGNLVPSLILIVVMTKYVNNIPQIKPCQNCDKDTYPEPWQNLRQR